MQHITVISLSLNLFLILHALGYYWEQDRRRKQAAAKAAKEKEGIRRHVNACLHISASAARKYTSSNN